MAQQGSEDSLAQNVQLSHFLIDEILNEIIKVPTLPILRQDINNADDPSDSSICQSIKECNNPCKMTDAMVNRAEHGFPKEEMETFKETCEAEDEEEGGAMLKENVVQYNREGGLVSAGGDASDIEKNKMFFEVDESSMKRKCTEEEPEICSKFVKADPESVRGLEAALDDYSAGMRSNDGDDEGSQSMSPRSPCKDGDSSEKLTCEASDLEINEDCRSVLTMIIDHFVYQVTSDSMSDKESESASILDKDQPPEKRMKLTPSSDFQSIKNLPGSNLPGFIHQEEMEVVLGSTPKLTNTSSEIVKPSQVWKPTDNILSILKAAGFHANINTDVAPQGVSDSGHRTMHSKFSSEFTSTLDVTEDRYGDVRDDKFSTFVSDKLFMSHPSSMQSDKSSRVPETNSGSIGVSTSTPDISEDSDVDCTVPKDMSLPPVVCEDISLFPPSNLKWDKILSIPQTTSDMAGMSTSTPDMKKDKGEDIVASLKALAKASIPRSSNNLKDEGILTNEDLEKASSHHATTTNAYIPVCGVSIIKQAPTCEESACYSSILAEDLCLEDSIDCSESSEALNLNSPCDNEHAGGFSEVGVIHSDDACTSFLEPVLQEDILSSQRSINGSFSCCFQTASQVLANSQEETAGGHYLRDADALLPENHIMDMISEDLQVPNFVNMAPIGVEMTSHAVLDDWEAAHTMPEGVENMLKTSEVPVLGQPGITSDPLNKFEIEIGESEDKPLEVPSQRFLQVLKLSPKQTRAQTGDQSKPCDTDPRDALPKDKLDSSTKVLEAVGENKPYALLPSKEDKSYSQHAIKDSEVKPTPADNHEQITQRRGQTRATRDQTVPSLQTSVEDNPGIDELLELEESIFTEQDCKLLGGQKNLSLSDLEDVSLVDDCEDKAIPDHLQTLGQTAAGVFHWRQSLADASLTPQDQSALTYRGNHQDRTPSITPVRPLPVGPCQRRRRVGLSRRQLVYPLHARTSSK